MENVAAAGRLVNGKREGKWQFFITTGRFRRRRLITGISVWKRSTIQKPDRYKPILSLVNREAVLKGGPRLEKLSLKTCTGCQTWEFSTGGSVTVGVSFIVDENGNSQMPKYTCLFHEAFDAIALKVIRSSLSRLPAYAHNRRVKAYFRQPVSFAQPEE